MKAYELQTCYTTQQKETSDAAWDLDSQWVFVVGDGEGGTAEEHDKQRTKQLGDDAAPEAQTTHILL